MKKLLSLVLLVAIITGCAEKTKEEERIEGELNQNYKFTKSELDDLGYEIEGYLADYDSDGLESKFDVTKLMYLSTENLNLDQAMKNELLDPANSGMLVKQLFEDIVGNIRYLGQKRVENEYFLTYRILYVSSVNYLLFKVGKRKNKNVVYDVFSLGSGELFSHSLERVFSHLVVGGNDIDEGMIESVERFNELRESGQYQEALDYYDYKLPAKFKKERAVQLNALQIALEFDEDEYDKRLREFYDIWGDNDSLALMMISLHVDAENYEMALKGVDQVEKMVGADPYLDIYRAQIYTYSGDSALARDYFSRHNYDSLGLDEEYLSGMADYYIFTNQYEEAVTSLDRLVNEYDYDKYDLMYNIEDVFPEFSESEEYNTWMYDDLE